MEKKDFYVKRQENAEKRAKDENEWNTGVFESSIDRKNRPIQAIWERGLFKPNRRLTQN